MGRYAGLCRRGQKAPAAQRFVIRMRRQHEKRPTGREVSKRPERQASQALEVVADLHAVPQRSRIGAAFASTAAAASAIAPSGAGWRR